MSEIVVRRLNQGGTVDAYQGDSIVISLDENPTTGYRWEVHKVNSRILELQDSDYLIAPGAIEIGGGGTRTIRFRANWGGNGLIQLRLRRAWEPEDVYLEHFEVTITVKETE